MTTPTVTGNLPGQRRLTWPILLAVILVMAVQVTAWLSSMFIRTVLAPNWQLFIALQLTLGVLSCCLVRVLHRQPVGTALIAAVLVVGSMAAAPVSAVATVQVARTRRSRTAVLVAAAGVVGYALRGLWQQSGLSLALWIVMVVAAQAAFALWGVRARIREELIGSLRDRAEIAEAEQQRRVAQAKQAERSRIAREMHDVLAHRLSMIATYAGALEFRPDTAADQRERAARVIRESSHQALQDLRDVIGVLRDEEQGSGECSPTLAADDVVGLVQESRDAGVPVDLTAPTPLDLPPRLRRTIYRVVQEGLTNVRKHAPGRPASVIIEPIDTGWSVRISNPPAASMPTGVPGAGVGLIGLAERVRLAGGTLQHTSSEEGFELSATLPWCHEPGSCADR